MGRNARSGASRMKRSLTMTGDQIASVYERAAKRTDCLQDGVVAVALEAERRLLAKLRAVPVETLAQFATLNGLLEWDLCTSSMKDDARARAKTVRDALLAAVEHVEES